MLNRFFLNLWKFLGEKCWLGILVLIIFLMIILGFGVMFFFIVIEGRKFGLFVLFLMFIVVFFVFFVLRGILELVFDFFFVVVLFNSFFL